MEDSCPNPRAPIFCACWQSSANARNNHIAYPMIECDGYPSHHWPSPQTKHFAPVLVFGRYHHATRSSYFHCLPRWPCKQVKGRASTQDMAPTTLFAHLWFAVLRRMRSILLLSLFVTPQST